MLFNTFALFMFDYSFGILYIVMYFIICLYYTFVCTFVCICEGAVEAQDNNCLKHSTGEQAN